MKKLMTLLATLLPCMGLTAQHAAQAQSQRTAQAEGQNPPSGSVQEDLDPQYAVDLLKPGAEAPDFTLQDINGKSLTLSSFRGRKVVLVFWASWCPDCRAEVPQLKALHAGANPEKVAFVSVSFDRTFEALKQYAEENYLPGVQLFDPAGKKESAVAAQYGVKWIPSLFLIDENGKVEVGTVMLDKVERALKDASAQTPGKPGRQLCSDESCAL